MTDEDAILRATIVCSEEEVLAEFQECCEAEAETPGQHTERLRLALKISADVGAQKRAAQAIFIKSELTMTSAQSAESTPAKVGEAAPASVPTGASSAAIIATADGEKAGPCWSTFCQGVTREPYALRSGRRYPSGKKKLVGSRSVRHYDSTNDAGVITIWSWTEGNPYSGEEIALALEQFFAARRSPGSA